MSFATIKSKGSEKKYFTIVVGFLLSFLLLSIPWRFPAPFYKSSALNTVSEKEAREFGLCASPSNENTLIANRDFIDIYDDDQLAFELDVNDGGIWKPSGCHPVHNVTILVPYRNRSKNLKIFSQYIHKYLQHQQVQYHLILVEQTMGKPFNRAKLFNVGYTESGVKSGSHCFIFHDVDLLPESLGNTYGCGERPRHLSVLVNTLRYVLPYQYLVGGVLAVKSAVFKRINGYSNKYLGWGGEDDDLYQRFLMFNIDVERPSPALARYTMLQHKLCSPSTSRYHNLMKSKERVFRDGLSSLSYQIVLKEAKPLYTRILVDL